MQGKKPPQQYEFGQPQVPVTRWSSLLEKLEKLVDFEFIRERTRPYFATLGRPSIDPTLMLKMMLPGYLFRIESDRELVDRCADSLAFREFLHLGTREPVPVHANFTHWRQRLGAEFFRELLHEVVLQLHNQGMEVSAARTIDATGVKAQASKRGPVVERPVGVSVEEFVTAYFAGDPPAPEGEGTVALNLHDPQARLQRKRGEVAEFRYQASFCADPQSGLITDAVATPLEQAPTAVEHVAHDPFPVAEVVADGKYDHGATLGALQAQGVTPYVPQTNHDKPGQLSKAEFTYHPEDDYYLCPQGVRLERSRYRADKQWTYYSAPRSACGSCARQAECTTARRRVVTRTATEEARAATVRAGPRYEQLQDALWSHEHLHMLAKRDHGMDRARGLGLEAMCIQVALTALAINLKKAIAWQARRLLLFVLPLLRLPTNWNRRPAFARGLS